MRKLLATQLAREGTLGQALIKAAIGSIGIKLAYTAIGFFIATLTARLLGPGGFGVYSFAMAVISFMVIPSELGIPALATREIAVNRAKSDWPRMRGFILWAHRAIGTISVILIVGGAIAVYLRADVASEQQTKSIALGLLLVPLLSLGALRAAMLRGLRKVVLCQLPEMIIKPALVATTLALMMVFARDRLMPSDVVVIQVFAATVAFAFGLYFYFRNRPPELAQAQPVYDSRAWLKSTVPFALMAGLALINGQTDILALGTFREHAEVGVYRVAVQMATLVIFGLQVINPIQGPHIAHLYAMGDMRRLQQMVTRSSQGVLLLTLPVVLVLVVFGKPLISLLFGPRFESAYLPLVILCVGQLVNAATGSVRSILNMTGNERDSTRSLLIGSIVNVALNLTLTPLWGMVGAAIATSLTLIVWNTLMLQAVRRRTGINTSPLLRRHS